MNKPSQAFGRLMSRKSPVVVEPIREEDVKELELPKRPIWETEPADSINSRSEAPAEDSKVAAS